MAPRVVTRRDVIRNVPNRYEGQYSEDTKLAGGRNTGEVKRQLRLLDIETATVEEIEKIIGNNSWTRLSCDVCEDDCEAVVSVPREYESPISICYRCASGVAAMLATVPAQAIEARSAATAKTGAVEDESAVPEGCAHD